MEIQLGQIAVHISFDAAATANFVLLVMMHLKHKKQSKRISIVNADEIDISGLKFRKGEDF